MPPVIRANILGGITLLKKLRSRDSGKFGEELVGGIREC